MYIATRVVAKLMRLDGFKSFVYSICCLGVMTAAVAENAPTVQWTYQCGSEIYSSPVVADLTDESGLEILIASSAERKIFCLNSAGKALWTFGEFNLRITSTPTVADIDGDGKPEILVATRSDGVVCLNGRGERIREIPVTGGIPWGNVSVAVTAPNKRPAMYWVSLPGSLESHHPDGTLNWSHPVDNPGPRGPLAVGDLDGDGREDIVAGGGLHSVHCVDYTGHERWRLDGMAPFHCGPVIVDLEDDSRIEVLAASDDGLLFCLKGSSGEVIWNHRTFTGRIDTSIAAGDVDGDGKREVFYGDGNGHFYALNCSGEERWSFDAGDWIESAPAIGDVDGDGGMDVLVGSGNGALYCLSSAGRLKWKFDTGKRISASPTLCDANEDGKVDILIPSHNGILYCLTVGGAWNPKKIVWPCKRYDLAQTAGVK